MREILANVPNVPNVPNAPNAPNDLSPEQHRQERLLHVQPILGLIEHD